LYKGSTAGGKPLLFVTPSKLFLMLLTILQASFVVCWFLQSHTRPNTKTQNPGTSLTQKINSHFGNKVEVDKDVLLQGSSFNATPIKEQLNICFSFDLYSYNPNKWMVEKYAENGSCNFESLLDKD
jgi:hypothetical protein